MLWSATILFLSMGLLVYWAMRALLIMRGSEEQINYVLDSDLRWGRKFLLILRVLLNPSSQFLLI
jgi:hypothetical protein